MKGRARGAGEERAQRARMDRGQAADGAQDCPGAPSARSWIPCLLALLALQLLAWSRSEGYQLADSVEYLDRARALVYGETLSGSESVRSFAFSALFVPLFAAVRWMGLDPRAVVAPCANLLQMALGLLLVARMARLGAQIAGRSAGIAAAWLVGLSPVLVRYSITPISGLAAAVCVVLALEAISGERGFRPGLRAGAWLGVGLLMAYQTLLISLPLGALVLARDMLRPPQGSRRGAMFAGFACGLLAGALVQVALDKAIYGAWGVSLYRYVVENFGGFLGRIALEAGFQDLAVSIYRLQHDLRGWEYGLQGEPPAVRQVNPPLYYAAHMPELFSAPALFFLALGALACLLRRRWQSTGLLLVLLADLFVMSTKGSKSLRLCVPLLPLFAPIAALGWACLAGSCRDARRPLRRAMALALVAIGSVLSMKLLLRENLRFYSGYWQAMEFVNDRTRDAKPMQANDAEPNRVASAFHWAVFLRNDQGVEVEKLPHQLDLWSRLDDAQRSQVLEALPSCTWLIVHQPVLTSQGDLFEAVNASFSVEGAFYDQRVNAGIGPVYALRRREVGAAARTFFGVEQARASAESAWTTHFTGEDPGGSSFQVTFLGWDYEPLPGPAERGHGWITYYWTTSAALERDYEILDRVTAPDEHNSWQNNHSPAYGLRPTTEWRPGEIVRESYLLVAGADVYYEHVPYRPLGGAYRRGDWIPASLWLDVVLMDQGEHVTGRLHARPSREGRLAQSRDGFTLAGKFLLPAHADVRVPDDGKPIAY